MPSGSEVFAFLEQYYATWGYLIVFIAAILESTPFTAWFVPGVYLAILGAIYSTSGIISFPSLVFSLSLGWFIGDNIDFVFGRLGWYSFLNKLGFGHLLSRGERWMKKHEGAALLIGHVSPNISWSVTMTSGILKIPYRTFFWQTLLSVILWSTAYGTVGYLLGYQRPLVEKIFDWAFWPFIALFVVWVLWRISLTVKHRRIHHILP